MMLSLEPPTSIFPSASDRMAVPPPLRFKVPLSPNVGSRTTELKSRRPSSASTRARFGLGRDREPPGVRFAEFISPSVRRQVLLLVPPATKNLPGSQKSGSPGLTRERTRQRKERRCPPAQSGYEKADAELKTSVRPVLPLFPGQDRR